MYFVRFVVFFTYITYFTSSMFLYMAYIRLLILSSLCILYTLLLTLFTSSTLYLICFLPPMYFYVLLISLNFFALYLVFCYLFCFSPCLNSFQCAEVLIKWKSLGFYFYQEKKHNCPITSIVTLREKYK